MWDREFTGKGSEQRSNAPAFQDLPGKDRESGYIADPDLSAAVNVALLLGQPLLVTGEPGTGKSHLARRIAWEFGQERPLTFIARTKSEANDLFYTYNALHRFLDAQDTKQEAADPLQYVTFQALGLAILLALPLEMSKPYRHLMPRRYQDVGPLRPVVLIDEIDKAPRDLPNDILNEIEEIQFTLKETGTVIPDFAGEEFELAKTLGAEEAKRVVRGYRETFERNRPILILTSNEERPLPHAFLRRCVYFYIKFPDSETLMDIVANRLGGGREPKPEDHPKDMPPAARSKVLPSKELPAPYNELSYIDLVFDRFHRVRDKLPEKKPATAELISWMRLLVRKEITLEKLQRPALALDAILSTIGVLAKNEEDRKAIENLFRDLAKNRTEASAGASAAEKI